MPDRARSFDQQNLFIVILLGLPGLKPRAKIISPFGGADEWGS